MKLIAELQYRSIGVGKYKTKHVYLYIKGHSAIALPKSSLKKFFPNLPYGSDGATRKVTVEIL